MQPTQLTILNHIILTFRFVKQANVNLIGPKAKQYSVYRLANLECGRRGILDSERGRHKEAEC